jgi:hypothetical protein
MSLLPPPPDGAEQGAIRLNRTVDVPLVAKLELHTGGVHEQVCITQFVHAQAFQVRQMVGEPRGSDGYVAPLSQQVLLTAEPAGNVDRLRPEGSQILDDCEHLSVELIQRQRSGANLDHLLHSTPNCLIHDGTNEAKKTSLGQTPRRLDVD